MKATFSTDKKDRKIIKQLTYANKLARKAMLILYYGKIKNK